MGFSPIKQAAIGVPPPIFPMETGFHGVAPGLLPQAPVDTPSHGKWWLNGTLVTSSLLGMRMRMACQGMATKKYEAPVGSPFPFQTLSMVVKFPNDIWLSQPAP